MLSVSVIASAKLSIVSLLLILSPVNIHRYVTWTAAIVILLWWTVSEFAIAFQCHLPETWNPIKNLCIDKASLGHRLSTVADFVQGRTLVFR